MDASIIYHPYHLLSSLGDSIRILNEPDFAKTICGIAIAALRTNAPVNTIMLQWDLKPLLNCAFGLSLEYDLPSYNLIDLVRQCAIGLVADLQIALSSLGLPTTTKIILRNFGNNLTYGVFTIESPNFSSGHTMHNVYANQHFY